MNLRRVPVPGWYGMADGRLHVCVVSHGHGAEVALLLADLARLGRPLSVQLILNRPEDLAFSPGDFIFPLAIRANPRPLGFAANNNLGFRLAAPNPEDWFAMINPDVRLPEDVFAPLLACLARHPEAGAVAPLVRNGLGEQEDNARRLPTPGVILGKACGRREPVLASESGDCRAVDWVAGLFMLCPARHFAAVGGFDEAYHLYYEDVDLCSRLGLAGHPILWAPSVAVVHDGKRHSHRHLRYSLWHLGSMARFFLSSVYRQRRRQLRFAGTGGGEP